MMPQNSGVKFTSHSCYSVSWSSPSELSEQRSENGKRLHWFIPIDKKRFMFQENHNRRKSKKAIRKKVSDKTHLPLYYLDNMLWHKPDKRTS